MLIGKSGQVGWRELLSTPVGRSALALSLMVWIIWFYLMTSATVQIGLVRFVIALAIMGPVGWAQASKQP